jgi:hypothetical protein
VFEKKEPKRISGSKKKRRKKKLEENCIAIPCFFPFIQCFSLCGSVKIQIVWTLVVNKEHLHVLLEGISGLAAR